MLNTNGQTKHTPAPWRIEATEEFYSVLAVNHDAPPTGSPAFDPFVDYDSIVADLRDGAADELEANAHLIAAAPELLESLEMGANAMRILADDAKEAGSPIGEQAWKAREAKARAAIAKAKGENA